MAKNIDKKGQGSSEISQKRSSINEGHHYGRVHSNTETASSKPIDVNKMQGNSDHKNKNGDD